MTATTTKTRTTKIENRPNSRTGLLLTIRIDGKPTVYIINANKLHDARRIFELRKYPHLNPGQEYAKYNMIIDDEKKTVFCDCPAAKYRGNGDCKHCQAMKALIKAKKA